MESHVLNTYHQARYRIHGLNRTSTSESYSSESSCTQNSPEYPDKLRDEWKGKRCGGANVTNKGDEDSSDSSSDYDEVPEGVMAKREPADAYDQAQSELANDGYYGEEMVVGESDDDYEIVVDDEAPSADGPIIQVYAVHPDLDLEGSEDEEDFPITEGAADGNSYDVRDEANGEGHLRERHDSLGINLDVPVVTNVDEYFIKERKDEEQMLELKDQTVVSDVDEYFVRDEPRDSNANAEEITPLPNVDEFFIKPPRIEKEPVNLDLVEVVPNVEEFFNRVVEQPEEVIEEPVEVKPVPEDSDVLPHIEHIKRFLLEGMPCKQHTKSIQRSCSLPHSPAHISYFDADDAKTSLSFEDLNIDLSDFSFDEGKADKNVELPLEEDANTSDDNPRTLTEEDVNSFLITSKPDSEKAAEEPSDDLSQEDMEIDVPVESKIDITETLIAKPIDDPNEISAIPKASTVFDFCIEKPASEVKVKKIEPKVEVDDFVDVESLNDTVIPVLEATNVSALLEQFEATEKFNTNVKKKLPIKIEATVKAKVGNGLPSGVRLQDAGAQLNKNKMRHILMSTPTSNSSVKKTSQTVHSDHDYCSPKKRHSLPAALKCGQSLLKPEVLSSNNKILSSRHRSCKNKKVVYHLSSDDDDSNSSVKNKTSVKPSVKIPLLSNHRKKLSPIPSVANVSVKENGNVSVMSNNASKASDNSSQSSSGSIKLTIKNKSKVILKMDCDDKKDSQKVIKHNESMKPSVSKLADVCIKSVKQESNAKTVVNDVITEKNSNEAVEAVVKEETRPIKEDFYTALFKNKQDIHIAFPEPTIVKPENKTVDSNENKLINDVVIIPVVEIKPLKKKLNLQEYKLRREGANSNGGSRTVSPEAIFPEIQVPINFEKTNNSTKAQVAQNEVAATAVKSEIEEPKKLFDPIRDASRKILANTKKQKAEATRKRDEDIVMSKIPKVENLELQPLISDAEMLKIVGMAQSTIAPLAEKPKNNTDYVEIVLVSVGTNTDEAIFKQLNKEQEKRKSHSPTSDKSLINFRIKKSENVLKQNVFDPVKKDSRSPEQDRNVSPNKETKIDKERYKDITRTLKSVGKQVDKRICSNSLFASIQDVVMKKAPDQDDRKPEERKSSRKLTSPIEKKSFFKPNAVKTTIVRDYDPKTEHGEDKIILHLEKNRTKPSASHGIAQTDPSTDFNVLTTLKLQDEIVRPTKCIRMRTVSDMSVSSEEGSRPQKDKKDEKKVEKRKSEERTNKRSRSRNRRTRSRSRSRYRSKYSRRNRRTRTRSRSRCRSRSIERYRYRRSHSPPRRSPYRSPRSRRRYRRRSRSRDYRSRSRSPVTKKGKTPDVDKKEMTPRKPTVSESSDASTSSTSSSSSGSGVSRSRSRSKSRRSASPARRGFGSYTDETRDSTPVEERRIVFVGKLEKDVSKSTLRGLFGKFGPILEVTLHSKEDGCRYGFVTFQRARDAWSAVEAASTFPNYDVGFGGRRAFCRQRYADLDGLEADYSEGYLGPPPAAVHQNMSFEQMLLEMKHKLSQRKTEKRDEAP